MTIESQIDYKLIMEMVDDVVSQTDEKGYIHYISSSCI